MCRCSLASRKSTPGISRYVLLPSALSSFSIADPLLPFQHQGDPLLDTPLPIFADDAPLTRVVADMILLTGVSSIMADIDAKALAMADRPRVELVSFAPFSSAFVAA